MLTISFKTEYIKMMIITLSILFYSVGSIYIDPINVTCIEPSSYTKQNITMQDRTQIQMPIFDLPPFSQSIILIDLRHLSQTQNWISSMLNLQALIMQSGQTHQQRIQQIEILNNSYIFYVDQKTRLGLYFNIDSQYEAYKYLLYGTISIKIVPQNKRILQQTQSFLFVVSSLDGLNLPANRPAVQNYSGYYIDKISFKSPMKSRSIEAQTANDYWTTFNTLAVPFIPYISNCFGQGSRMFLSQLTELDKDCDLKEIDETIPIDQFKFGSSPTADSCHIKRQCVYDEQPGVSVEFPYWLTLNKDTTIFSITSSKVKAQQYQMSKSFDSKDLIRCNVNDSKGANSSSDYPLNVKLTLQYYQQTATTKRMISCTMTFSLYMQSSVNFPYQFELQTKPLNHTYIMLAFGFKWYIYMIVFVIIGTISNFENLVLWLFHYFVSRKEKKQFRVLIYLRVIFQIAKGTFFALAFCLIFLFGVSIIMNGKIFTSQVYSSSDDYSVPVVFWDYINSNYISDYSSEIAVKFRSGRMGLSYFVVGSFILFYTSKSFIGCEKKSKQYNDYEVIGRLLKPREWNRGKFIFGTYVYICIQFFFIYFAYSATYSNNIWVFIVLMKIIQIIMEEITLSIYEDALPCLPLKVVTDITAYMNTLSADNLYDFLFSFLIDVAITMIEKAYVPQIQNILVDKIHQKLNQIFRFYAYLINDAEGEVNKDVTQKAQQVEQESQFVLMNGQTEQIKFFENEDLQQYNEDNQIELRIQDAKAMQKTISHKLLAFRRFENKKYADNHNNETEEQQNVEKTSEQKMQESSMVFQILLDNTLLFFTFLLQPFVVLVFWITYEESSLLNNYGISFGVVILYLLSAVVIAFFTIINMILIFHLLQCFLEVDFQQIIAKLFTRFFDRKIFWKAFDEDINTQIQIKFRGADHYCLSWQFFFILALYVSSMILVILGICIMINSKYNPFNDNATSLVVAFWCVCTIILINIFQKLGYKFNIDNWRGFDQNSQNVNAIADLSVKQQFNLKSSQEGTNQQLISSQSSNLEIGGSTLMLRKSRKGSAEIEANSIKKLISDQIISQDEQSSGCSWMSEDTLNTKVMTICKKLQSQFTNNKFSLQYFQKNKQFVRQNIDKILPLMDQLPEINEYRVPSSEFSITESSSKKDSKNYDMFMEQVITIWKNKAESCQRQRQKHGREKQQGLNNCSFCFEPWGIYYGFNGICLKCSSLLASEKKNI